MSEMASGRVAGVSGSLMKISSAAATILAANARELSVLIIVSNLNSTERELMAVTEVSPVRADGVFEGPPQPTLVDASALTHPVEDQQKRIQFHPEAGTPLGEYHPYVIRTGHGVEPSSVFSVL